jgi:molecular chaperone DnaK
MVITNAPLTHSIGVEMANGEVDFLLKKGRALPCQEKSVHHQVAAVRKGNAADAVRVPIVEGEHKRAGRNRKIGEMAISGSDAKLKRDIPAGSDVEIVISMNESRIMTAKAFIPFVEEELECTMKLEFDAKPTKDLESLLEAELKRLAELSEKANLISDVKAQEALRRIEAENTVAQVRSLLQAANASPSSAIECEHRLMDLSAAIDEVEDALEVPHLIEDAQSLQQTAADEASKNASADEKHRLGLLQGELRKAVDSRDPDVVRQRMEEVKSLYFEILLRQPSFWVGYLQYLEEQKSAMRDVAMAEQLIAQGHRAINNQDVEALKAAVRQLISLLPPTEQEQARGYGGTTIRKSR